MLPAGDNGTYFQFFPLERLRVSATSSVTLAGKTLRMGEDVVTDALVVRYAPAPSGSWCSRRAALRQSAAHVGARHPAARRRSLAGSVHAVTNSRMVRANFHHLTGHYRSGPGFSASRRYDARVAFFSRPVIVTVSMNRVQIV